jgi:tRNA splicing endonuclease
MPVKDGVVEFKLDGDTYRFEQIPAIEALELVDAVKVYSLQAATTLADNGEKVESEMFYDLLKFNISSKDIRLVFDFALRFSGHVIPKGKKEGCRIDEQTFDCTEKLKSFVVMYLRENLSGFFSKLPSMIETLKELGSKEVKRQADLQR